MDNKNIHTIDVVRDAEAFEEILSSGVIFPLVVTGSSMFPFLKDGIDTVRLQKTDKLYKGQIVFFRRVSGEFTLHRIRKIFPDGRLLINGDAQSWCEIISPGQVLAAVVSISKNGHNVDPDNFVQTLFRVLWYPTRRLRPFIWRVLSFIKKIFKKQ